MSPRSRVLPVWLALAAAFTMSAFADPDDTPAPRFVPVEVYLESSEPVAAWQFELADRAGAMKVVGIERGGHDAFPRAPYYDGDALADGTAPRIVVADYSLVLESALPRGRFRLATLHLVLEGEPDYALRLVTATAPDGAPINASIALRDSPEDPPERERLTHPGTFATLLFAVVCLASCSVSEFLMVIGDRTIRGILREKEEAEAIYRQARERGYRASLLVQRRPNIFEQKVANIEPGTAIDVDITYFHTLAYQDSWYSFVFPTVVGPRYNPAAQPRRTHGPHRRVAEGRKDRASGSHGRGVPRADRTLRPRSRHHRAPRPRRPDRGVEVHPHEIAVERGESGTATVRLADATTIPNRDFVLDLRVAGETVRSSLLTYRDIETGDGCFTLQVIPPRDAGALARRPMEMAFVLDCSGSMSGRPLDQAKEAVVTALTRLEPYDTFQIIRFSDDASTFGPAPVPATEVNLAATRRYLAVLDADGGTEMLRGIRAALDFPQSPTHLRFVSFMTDGYIGNEADILAAVHRHIGNARIFSFGVGSSVNRYLMERMAKEGRGVAAYLGLHDSAEEVMANFFDRASRPALTDVEVDWGGMTVRDTCPARLPDLFVGRPLVVAGRFEGDPTALTLSGTADDARRAFVAEPHGETAAGPYIAWVWARLNIADLADRQAIAGDPHGELRDAIMRVALRHQLASSYTSFVAVDSSMRTEGTHGVTVHQAVPVPDGVRYDTTVE